MNEQQLENPATGGRRFIPLILSAAIIGADQISKALVVRHIEPYRLTRDTVSVIGNFVSFIRTQNLGVALSVGQTWPPAARRVMVIAVPLIVIVLAGFYLIRGRDLTRLQRWSLAGIVGGGLGNLIDRIFRPDGVIDFVMVNMYGFLGQHYFPIFNVADSTVTVCGIILIAALLFTRTPAPPADSTSRGEVPGAEDETGT